MPDYYSLLQLSSNASLKQIRTSYRRLAKTCHPDLHPGDAALNARFIQLTQAYETLSDEGTRRRYDDERRIRHPAEPPRPERSTHYYTPRSQEDFLKDMMATYKASQQKPIHIEWMHAVVFSPVTYCVVVVLGLLFAYKMSLDNITDAIATHHH